MPARETYCSTENLRRRM